MAIILGPTKNQPPYQNLKTVDSLSFQINFDDLRLTSSSITDSRFFVGLWVMPKSGANGWNFYGKGIGSGNIPIYAADNTGSCWHLKTSPTIFRWYYFVMAYSLDSPKPTTLTFFKMMRGGIYTPYLGPCEGACTCSNILSALEFKPEYRKDGTASERTIDFGHLTGAGKNGHSAEIKSIITGILRVDPSNTKAVIGALPFLNNNAVDKPNEFFFTRFNFDKLNPGPNGINLLAGSLKSPSGDYYSSWTDLYPKFDSNGLSLKNKEQIYFGEIDLWIQETDVRIGRYLSLHFLLYNTGSGNNISGKTFQFEFLFYDPSTSLLKLGLAAKLVFSENQVTFTTNLIRSDGVPYGLYTTTSSINYGVNDFLEISLSYGVSYEPFLFRLRYYPFLKIRTQSGSSITNTQPAAGSDFYGAHKFSGMNPTASNKLKGYMKFTNDIADQNSFVLSLTHLKVYSGGYNNLESDEVKRSLTGQTLANCFDEINSEGSQICLKCFRGFYWDHDSKTCKLCSSALPGCRQCTKSHLESAPVCNSCGMEERQASNLKAEGCNLRQCNAPIGEYTSRCIWCEFSNIDKTGCSCPSGSQTEDCQTHIQSGFPNCKIKI